MASRVETVYPALQKEWVVYQPTVELTPVAHTHETLEKWANWLQDPDVHLWMTGDLPDTMTKVNKWLYDATHDPRRHYFTILADGNMVGIVNLRTDHVPSSTAEIGIVIGEADYRSCGVGTKTIEKILEITKNDLHLQKVRAHILPENEKSIRLFTGQGFVHTQNVTVNHTPMLRFEKTIL